MATTDSWLTSSPGGPLALSLVIEGTSFARTTATASEMNTAWTGTDWASAFVSGMKATGEIGTSAEPFVPQISPDTARFTFVDYDKSLASLLVEGLVADSTVYTEITSNVSAGDATINVVSTSAFASSGTIYIGRSAYTYSGTTATTFTGCAPTYSIGATDTAADFEYSHLISEDTGYHPTVTTRPQTWIGRLCALYLHHKENGAWVTRANARLCWVGRVTGKKQGGGTDPVWSIEARSILADLTKVLPTSQFMGTVAQGIYFDATMAGIRIQENITGSATDEVTTLAGTGAQLQAPNLRSLIQEQFNAWEVAGDINHGWAITGGVPGLSSGTHLNVTTTGLTDPGDGYTLKLFLHEHVWRALGYDVTSDPEPISVGGVTYYVHGKEISRTGINDWTLDSPHQAPDAVIVATTTLTVDNSTGDYGDQHTMPPDVGAIATATGFLVVGDNTIVAAVLEATPNEVFTIVRPVTQYFSNNLNVGNGHVPYIIVEPGAPPVKVRQVWFERDNLKAMFLRHVLSTGTEDHNSATYDKLGTGFGLAIPYSLVDVDSFDVLETITAANWIDKPEAFAEHVEHWLALHNACVTFSNGKITCQRFRFESASIGAAWTMDTSTKYAQNDRPEVTHGGDGVINQCALYYGKVPGASYKHTWIVRDAGSIARFGRAKTVDINSPGVAEPFDDEIRTKFAEVAADALAILGKSIAEVTVSYNFRLIGMACGDTVLLTDSYIADPRAGTYGITNEPCWVKSTKFDLASGKGMATLLFVPEVPPSKVGGWAPACKVTAISGDDLTVAEHAFSHSTEAVDNSHFAVGDVCRLRELSPVDPASPEVEDVVIDKITNSTTIQLTTSPSVTSSIEYILEYRTFATAVTAQKANAFLADDADNLVAAGISPYLWGTAADTVPESTVNYDNRVVEYQDANLSVKGRPHTVADWYHAALSLNTILSYDTRTAPLRQWFVTGPAVVGTTDTLVLPSFACPQYGYERELQIHLHVTHSTAGSSATFTVTISDTPCQGDALTTITFPGISTSTTVTSNSTTGEWKTTTLAMAGYAANDVAGAPPTLYVTVEARAGAGGETATLNGFVVWEDSL